MTDGKEGHVTSKYPFIKNLKAFVSNRSTHSGHKYGSERVGHGYRSGRGGRGVYCGNKSNGSKGKDEDPTKLSTKQSET